MSDNKKTSVFGIYTTRESVERAVDTFLKSGFTTSDVSVLLPENLGGKPLATHKDTKAPEGATAGGGAGAVVGGTLGLLAGIGALAIPGLGPFIAAGPIMAALAGMGVGGAVGGFAGALIGMGIPEYEAKRYEGHSEGRDSIVGPLRHFRSGKAWQGNPEEHRSGRYFVHWRVFF